MKHRIKNGTIALTGLLALAMLAGCLDKGDEVSSPESSNNDPLTNNAPTISGIPAATVKFGDIWSFTPVASDPDGDPLTFSVLNMPGWASFDSSTGNLSGTPNLGDVGAYANVQITVSDGSLNSSLPQFSVEVTQIALGSVTLSWTAPTQNEDGSPLTNLVGYNFYYGTSSGKYPNQNHLDNPGITAYVIENLTPNTYYFVATAVNAAGVESSFTNEASKRIF